MSDHLPECLTVTAPHGVDMDCDCECLCEILRACETRVWDAAYAAGFNHGRAHGELLACPLSYKHGLDAAREAVEQVSSLLQPLGPALAAIDALMNDSSDTGTKMQDSE